MATDNAKYVRRGKGLAVAHDPGWEEDLMEANCSKEGAPFRYADGLIMAAAALRTALGCSTGSCPGSLQRCWTDMTRRTTPYCAGG